MSRLASGLPLQGPHGRHDDPAMSPENGRLRRRSVLTDPTLAAVEAAVASEIRVPLAALRASMETLCRDLAREDPRGRVLKGALEQVSRLGRKVGELIDYAIPPAIQPLSCSLAEVARGALDSLHPKQRARLTVAVEQADVRLELDGPLFARSLGRLLEAVADTGNEALLHVSCPDTEGTFSIHCAARGASACRRSTAAARPSVAAAGDEPAGRLVDIFDLEHGRDGLALALAGRDIRRMGGTIHRTSLAGGGTRVVVRVFTGGESGVGGMRR